MSNVRDSFLSECCRNKIKVKIYTTNGFQINGEIIAHDGEVLVLLQADASQAMVCLNAISTIIPTSPVLKV